MDPASAFGVASGALQTVQIIGSTIQGLHNLYGKYREADVTINSLIGELLSIRSALTQLDEWAKCDAHSALRDPVYVLGLDTAMDGCRTTLGALTDEINRLTRGIERNGESLAGPLRFRDRVSIIWNEELMTGHHNRLQSQVSTLNLLLQVHQCRTVSEQLELLRKEDTQSLIMKVRDDTATLRYSMSTVNSMASASVKSIRSGQSSAIGGTEFAFDDDVVNSTAYRWVMNQHMRSQSVGNAFNQNSQVVRHPSQGTRLTDEGYGSGTAGSRTPNRWPSNRLEVPIDGLRLTTLEDDMPRSNTTALARSSSAAYLNLRRSKSATSPLKTSGSKREKLRSVFRVHSRSGSAKSKPPVLSMPGSSTEIRALRSYRKAEQDVSIDLSSSGAAAPLIVRAAQFGDLAGVEVQLKGGADIEARHDETARTALAVAAHGGAEDIVFLLLQNQAEVDSQDIYSMTPLHLAASSGHTGIVELLLSQDIDIDQPDSLGRTPFWIAAEAGHIETAKLLLHYGCKVNTRATDQMTALHAAAQKGDPNAVAFLLRNHIDVHAKDSRLKTALHYSCEYGHMDVVQKLLSAGADIEAPGEAQSTPIISAAATGQLVTVNLLLKKGAMINAVDECGMTALHWAATNGHVEVVELLVKKKASITAAEQTGKQPLHCATYAKQFAVAEFLLRKNAPTNAKCYNNVTPFHAACEVGSLELVRLFIACGVDIDAYVRGSYRRAIHLAVIGGSLDTVDLLLDRKAKVNITDRMGDTPLTLACASGRIDIVQLLLERGASPARQSNDATAGVSPMCVAASKGHVDIVSLLHQNGGYVSEPDDMGWNALLHAAHRGHSKLLKFLLERCDLSAKQNLVAMFNNVGFAPNIVIEEDERDLISNLVADVSNELVRRNPFPDGARTASIPGSGAYYHQWFNTPQRPGPPIPPQELASTPSRVMVPPSRTETPPNSGDPIVRPNPQPVPVAETPPSAPTLRGGTAIRTPQLVRRTSGSSEHGLMVSSPVAPLATTAAEAVPAITTTAATPPVPDTGSAAITTPPRPIPIPRLSVTSNPQPSHSEGSSSNSLSADCCETESIEDSDPETPIRYSLVETIIGQAGNIHGARTGLYNTSLNESLEILPRTSQDRGINANDSTSSTDDENTDLSRTPTIIAPNSQPLIRNEGSWDERMQTSVIHDSEEESDNDSVATFDTAVEEVEVYDSQ